MNFIMDDLAKEYVNKRFPNASKKEREKIIRDWVNKEKDSTALVNDFVNKVFDLDGKKILDAGCGNGGISIAFSRAGADVVGIDIEKDLYNISMKNASFHNRNIKFILYDGHRMPFNDGEFDGAVSVSVLEHTSDPVFYLDEILRVVKPEGFLYLGFPNKLWPKETHTGLWFLTYLPAFFRPIYIKFRKRNPLKDNNLHFYSYFDLKRMLKKTKDDYFWNLIEEKGKSKSPVKKIVKNVLSLFGLSYKFVLPHILVVLKKNKHNE